MDDQSQQVDIPLVELDIFSNSISQNHRHLGECSCAVLVCHPFLRLSNSRNSRVAKGREGSRDKIKTDEDGDIARD